MKSILVSSVILLVLVVCLVVLLFSKKNKHLLGKINELKAKLQDLDIESKKALSDLSSRKEKEIKALQSTNELANNRLKEAEQSKEQQSSAFISLRDQYNKLMSSYESLAEANRVLSNAYNDLQEKMYCIEFKTEGKSKKVALNHTMLKVGAKLIESNHVVFTTNKEGEEVGLIFILKPESLKENEAN